MNKYLIRVLPLLLILGSAVCVAQTPQPAGDPRVERLRAEISYLASDELGGRRTGTPGAKLTAEHLSKEFSRLGLRRSNGRDLPGMSILEADSPKRYWQEFPYVAGVQLGSANLITTQVDAKGTGTRDLQAGVDWMPLGFSLNGVLDSPKAVFVGYGITASDLNHDDYANGAARDKLAIALEGTPDGDNPHGQFARYEDIRWKAIAARNAGAKALVVIAREPNFKDDRLSQLRYDNSGGDAGIIVFAISQQTAVRSFGIGDMNYLIRLASGDKTVPTDHAVATTGLQLLAFYDCFKRIAIDIKRNEVTAANVIGILDGSDPVLKDEYVVIGAHYDHLGNGGEGSLAPRSGDIHHGADDNASGTAALIELARTFTERHPRPKRTIVFMAFSGEEEGLLGSNYYVTHPLFPLEKTVAMINMDMIGRMKDNKLIIGGVGTASEWRDLVARSNHEVKALSRAEVDTMPPTTKPPQVDGVNGVASAAVMLPEMFALTLNEDGFGPSDHSSFYAKKVPVLFLFTGTHDDYHKPSDTADKINYSDEARVVGLVTQLVDGLAANDKRPTYAVAKSESTGRASGFRVYLGTIPNYGDATDGLLLDGVRDDSPASKAGLKAGDKIVKIGNRDVRNVYDYTYALGEMKAGQEYEMEVMRGGERVKLKITPAARK